MIGSLLFIQGNFKKASSHYSQAIDKFNKLKISPPLNIKLSLAKSLIEINDKEAACKDWNKSFQLGYMEVKESINSYCN